MQEKSILKEAIETSKLHLKRAKFIFDQLNQITIAENLFLDEEKIVKIDSFIFRFLKLQDFMGQKLFKYILKATNDYQDEMSMLDILDKLEKMNLIPCSENWISYKKVRNELTHEYPNNQTIIIEGIKVAMKQFLEIEEILLKIEKYISNIIG